MGNIDFTPDAKIDFVPAPAPGDFSDEDSPEAAEAKALGGGAEALAGLVTGTAGAGAGGLGYLGKSITNAAGLTSGDPIDVARGISDSMTYQPRGVPGQALTGAISEGMAAADRPIERAEDVLDPSGNLKATAQDVAERSNYVGAAAQALLPGLHPSRIEAATAAAHEPVVPSPGPALKPEEFAPKPPKPKITPKAGESAQAAAARQGIPTEPSPAPAAPSAAPGAKGTPAPRAVNDPSFFEAPDNQDLKSGTAGPEEQAARQAAVAQGAPTLQSVRDSAITNDYATQGRDWTGKQAGDATATAQIAAEGQALHSEAARISSETGGQLGTGESADAIRGKAYQDWHDSTVAALDKHIKDTYAAEDTEAKQYASPGSNLKGVLTDDSLIDNQNAGAVRSSTIALARKMGVDLTDPNAQLNGYQIENLRKHANATYGSAPRLAQAIKNAADADLPPQAYRRARALQKVKSDMFDNRDGINQLGPAKDGNRQVASPDVMKTIERMDPDQQGHIVNTMKRSASVLEGLGDHETAIKIGEKAHKAAQQLQSHFTERWIDEASKGGGWNTRRAHQFLKNNQETLSRVLTPEQMHQIRNVNNAANVLDLDKRYKGAFAQFAQGAGWLRRIGGTAALGTLEAGIAHATGGASVALKEAANVASGGKIDKALNQLGTGGRSTPKGFTRPMGQSPAFRKQGGWVNIGGKMVPEPADFEGGEHVTQETPYGHFVDENGDHVFNTAGGKSWITAEPTANGLRIRGSYTSPSERGQGHGGVLYQKAAEHATQNGGRFESDAIVSNDAARRWEELRRNGWDVKRDPNAKPTKNGLINEGDKPVFSTSGRVKEKQPLGAIIGGGKQRGAVGNLKPKAEPAPEFKEPEEPKGGAMVNIGLHQGNPAEGGRVMQPQEAVTALKQAGVKITKKTISNAGSEPTMVASLDRKLTPEEMQGVLAKTKQSAIPQRFENGEGEIHVAPGHEETAAKEGWNNYNPEYFRMHDDRTALEHATDFNPEELERENFTPHPSQTVTNPVRNKFPGIYDDPKAIMSRVKTAPEDPIMKDLFGVNRKNLHDMALGMGEHAPLSIPGVNEGGKARGSAAAKGVMNDANAKRLVNIIKAFKAHDPDAYHGMVGWYMMKPLHDTFVKELGAKVGTQKFVDFMHHTGMSSPASDVNTELNRGSASYMMAEKGRYNEFIKHGGIPVAERGKNFPPELENVTPHPYHRTAQAQPIARHMETGEGPQAPKTGMYVGASLPEGEGFQNSVLVGDAHFSRGVGLSDTRTNAKPGRSVTGPELASVHPWYKQNVAKPSRLPSTSAQAVQWGALSHETGVETPVGAPKLELFAQAVKKAADRVGVTPREMLKRIIRGQAHAG